MGLQAVAEDIMERTLIVSKLSENKGIDWLVRWPGFEMLNHSESRL